MEWQEQHSATQSSAEGWFEPCLVTHPKRWTLSQIFKKCWVLWLTSFVEMALEPFSGGCGWGLPLLYKTWNIARRAKVTAEDKALNVRSAENLCTASSVLWKTNSGYCLLSNLNTKKFFSTAQALLCERQQAPWASQILLWRWKGGSISWLLLEPVTVPCSQPAPSSPCSLLDELELKPKHRNVFFPGISCHWGPLCFYGVTQDPPQLLSAATFCLSIHPKAWLWLTPKEQKFS